MLILWIGLRATMLDAAPIISSSIKANVRSRVDYGYSSSIMIGMANAQGRTYFGYGLTDLENGTLPDENTLYEIGSVTKVFTSTLLAQMIGQGEVFLNETLESLLPEEVVVPKLGNRKITLEHLSTHTSGLPNNPPLEGVDPVNPFSRIKSLRGFDIKQMLITSKHNPVLNWDG